VIATTTLGGKAGWSPAARSVVEARQPISIEPSAPLAGDLARHAKPRRYAVVAKSLARQEYDLGPHDVAMR
jgi:hypothetical protein